MSATTTATTDVGAPQQLRPEHHPLAAAVFADAFLDDPAWVAVGPSSAKARWRWIQRICLGTMRVAERWCGPSWCVLEDEKPIGILVGSDPERWPPPRLRTMAALAKGPILAGPAVLARSLHTERVTEAVHPEYPHFLVWLFAVSPSHQRGGIGRRLMAEALMRADEVPRCSGRGTRPTSPTTAHTGST